MKLLEDEQISEIMARSIGSPRVYDISALINDIQSLRDSDVVHIETERALSDASNDFIRRVREAAGIAEGMEVYEIPDRISALRASERELRGMIAGLVEALELARRDLSQNGNYINATTMFIDRAITPAVRAVAEAAEKEKANAS